MTDIIGTTLGLLLGLLSVGGNEQYSVRIDHGANVDLPPGQVLSNFNLAQNSEDLREIIRQFVDELLAVVDAAVEKDGHQTQPDSGRDDEPEDCVTEHESGNGWSRTAIHCESKSSNSQSSSVQITSTTISSTNSTGP